MPIKGLEKPTYDLRNIGVDSRRFVRTQEESETQFLERCLSNLNAYGGRIVIDVNVDGVNREYIKTWFAGTPYKVTNTNLEDGGESLFVGTLPLIESNRVYWENLMGGIRSTVAKL